MGAFRGVLRGTQLRRVSRQLVAAAALLIGLAGVVLAQLDTTLQGPAGSRGSLGPSGPQGASGPNRSGVRIDCDDQGLLLGATGGSYALACNGTANQTLRLLGTSDATSSGTPVAPVSAGAVTVLATAAAGANAVYAESTGASAVAVESGVAVLNHASTYLMLPLRRVEARVSCAAGGNLCLASVACPAGSRLLGGSCSVARQSPVSATLTTKCPQQGGGGCAASEANMVGWLCVGLHPSNLAFTLSAYAQCLQD